MDSVAKIAMVTGAGSGIGRHAALPWPLLREGLFGGFLPAGARSHWKQPR